jgi:hypothetical protein
MFQRNHLQILKVETTGPSKTLVPIYRTIWYHIPQDHNYDFTCYSLHWHSKFFGPTLHDASVSECPLFLKGHQKIDSDEHISRKLHSN